MHVFEDDKWKYLTNSGAIGFALAIFLLWVHSLEVDPGTFVLGSAATSSHIAYTLSITATAAAARSLNASFEIQKHPLRVQSTTGARYNSRSRGTIYETGY